MLGIYAELDSRVNATQDAAGLRSKPPGLTHETAYFAGVDHAFFNDTGARYDADSPRPRHTTAMLDWFVTHLA